MYKEAADEIYESWTELMMYIVEKKAAAELGVPRPGHRLLLFALVFFFLL